MTDPGPELGGNSSHHEVKRSVIRVNEPNQLVGAVAASPGQERKKQSQDDDKDNKKAKRRAKGLKNNSNHNNSSPPTSPQPQDDKDKKGLRRAKGLKSNSNHSSNHASPPTSPQPHNNITSKKKKKRERRDFPNEKFGANRPVSVASRASSAGSVPSTGSGSNRGLHNQFPNEKFGSSRPAAAAPGAHSQPSTTMMIASAGRQSAPHYEHVHRQMPNVEPTIVIEPNTIDMGEEEPTIDVKPEEEDDDNNPQEYLVEASLVSMRESDDPAMAAEVLEAKEVTLLDVFQIKGVKCLLGSILGCFCVVLVALIVAIVLLTSSSESESIADSAQEFTLVPTLAPSFAPTSSQAGIAGTGLFGNDGEVGRYDECTIDMIVLADSPYPLESPVRVVAADTVSVTFAVLPQTWTGGTETTSALETVYVVPKDEEHDGVCERISSVGDATLGGTYTVDCEDGAAYVLVLVQDDVFSGYRVASECRGMEEHNIGYSLRLPCACDPEEINSQSSMEPPLADFVGTPPPDDYADFEPQLGEPLPAATPPPGVAPTDDYLPESDVPFDDDLYANADEQAPETSETEIVEEAESDSGSNAVVVVVVAIAAVLVALGMIAFVPLFLVYMRKKLQQEQARQAAEKKKKKKKGDPDKV